jgi:hypothetical protein
MSILGPWWFKRPNPFPRLIRTTVDQHRVFQVGNSCFDTLEKPIGGPVVNVFYKQEHLDDMCGAIEVPFMGVVHFPSVIVTARAWEQCGTNDLLYNRR